MKYIMVGTEEEFKYLGIRYAERSTSEKFNRVTCKLEQGYSLYIHGTDICTSFTNFLKSGEDVCCLLNQQEVEEDKINFIELYNPVGEIIYRF